MNTFDLALQAAAIDILQVYVLTLCPDSLIVALTPLYNTGGGVDPATNVGPFVAGDLTVNGLIGDGATKHLPTGSIPSTSLALTSAGATVYYFTGNNNVEVEAIVFNAVGQTFGLGQQSGNATFECFNQTAGQGFLQVANNNYTGYLSGNRTAANAFAIYAARSNLAHAALTSGATTGGTVPTVGGMDFFVQNTSGAGAQFFSSKRLSYCSMHQGLTQAQSLAQFNAIQALRTALGGGFA